MSSSPVRTRNLYDPASAEPYRFSRTKLELFLECPRCFYIDRRLGIGQPAGLPFTLNNAVDTLLKREFDRYRLSGEPHPIMIVHGVEAVPYRHRELERWRDSMRGIESLHAPTNLRVFGAVDDLWVDPAGSVMVVDYKSTSTLREINLHDDWKRRYKRQLEVYQWLLRRQGIPVLDRGYFVYVNADSERPAFDGHLAFTMHLLSYDGKTGWVDDALVAAHACLQEDLPPPSTEGCIWCGYRKAARGVEG